MFKLWKDITQDEKGKYVAKDVFKAYSFFAGLLLLFIAAGAGFTGVAATAIIEAGLILLSFAFGVQTVKEVTQYFHRKTSLENCSEACADEPAATEPTL